jgi:hypothetical protein
MFLCRVSYQSKERCGFSRRCNRSAVWVVQHLRKDKHDDRFTSAKRNAKENQPWAMLAKAGEGDEQKQ